MKRALGLLSAAILALAVLAIVALIIDDTTSRHESRWAETTGMASPRPSGGQ